MGSPQTPKDGTFFNREGEFNKFLDTHLAPDSRDGSLTSRGFGKVEVFPAVLVIGDGETAEQAARELAKLQPAILLFNSSLAQVPRVICYENYRISQVIGHAGCFIVTLEGPGNAVRLRVGGIVIAMETPTVVDPNLNLPAAQGIIGLRDFWSIEPREKWDSKAVAFVCGDGALQPPDTMGQALDLAIKLRQQYGTKVEFFFTQMTCAGDNEEKYREACERGVRFNRYVQPLDVHENVLGVTIRYWDPFLPDIELRRVLVDYLIAGEIHLPPKEAVEFSKLLEVELNPQGFFQVDNGRFASLMSTREGIYVLGSCRRPGSGLSVEVEARAVAARLARFATGYVSCKAATVARLAVNKDTRKVLVIGCGVAGMTAALELADHGIEVYLVEKTNRVGGKVVNYSCASADRCVQCPVCAVLELKARVKEHYGITLIFNSEVKSLRREKGRIRAGVRFFAGSRGENLGAETVLEVDAVAVAVGFELFDASLKDEFGYGQHKYVLTAFDLEKELKAKGSMEAAFGHKFQRICFIQCVGSRDVRAGHAYCSRVCCGYVNKLAKRIRGEFVGSQIDVFYRDIQCFDGDCQSFLERCKDDGIRYIRGIPAKIFRYPYDYLTVRYYDTFGQVMEERPYDMVILTPGVIPIAGLSQLAELTGLALDKHGFLTEQAEPGIFAAGTCTGPMNIPQTIIHAQATVAKILQYLSTQ